jgi:hypothetical protein
MSNQGQNKDPYGQHVRFNKDSVNEFAVSLLLKKDKADPGIGIVAFITGFSIRQSLLRYSMSLELSINDGLGLVDKSMLKMGSILELSLIRDLEKPEETEIKKLFYVTNINNSVQSLTQQERVYDITAYTFAAVSNAWPFTKVYGANYLPSDIIKDIVTTRFTSDTKEIGMSNKVADVHWIATQNQLKTPTIFNQVAPFDAITNMLRRSTGSEKDSTYFFYEDIEGFKLRTIGDMTSEENLNSSTKYTMFPDNKPTEKDNDTYYRILYLTQHNNADYFKIMKSGIYSGEVVYIDLLNRNIGNLNSLVEYSDSKYKESIMSIGKFDAFDINTDVFKLKGIPETSNPTTSEPSSYDITPASKIVFSEKAWDREDYMTDKHPYNSAQRALFEQNKVTIEVYGNTLIKPGDIIYIELPKQHQDEEGRSRRINRNFLVTGVKHNVVGGRFQTIVDLHKDSYELEILTESNENPSTLS